MSCKINVELKLLNAQHSLVVYLAFVCMLRALEKSLEIYCFEQYY
jgi:hypothetical protein